MTNDNKELGKILKRQRVMIPLTLVELSAKSGVSSSHLGRIERGNRFPSARVLGKIAKPLGFGENELFTLAGFLFSHSSSIVESETQLRRLDPGVAAALSQEPVEVQRSMFAILSALKYIAKVSPDKIPRAT